MRASQLSCSFLLFLLFPSVTSSLNADGFSLLALKLAITTDPHSTLSSWKESDSTPCKWAGITCSFGRVSGISLPNKGFTGYIPSEIGALSFLRRLSLCCNNFSNIIPSRLFNASSLTYVDLSHNYLTGSIPTDIKTLKTLAHLDLSANLLNGSLPSVLTEISSLSGTLNLSYNRFSGDIPESFGNFPVSVSLDLRHNNLTGRIPQVGSLLNQGPTAFAGNPNLCGFPLQTICSDSRNPQNPGNSKTPESPENPETSEPPFINDTPPKAKYRGISVPIISGIFFLVGMVFVSVWYVRKKWHAGEAKTEKDKANKGEGERQKGEFAVVDKGFGLDLEELLRASAYVVGKSRNGIVYKVVAGRGISLAVRRLSEGSGFWKFKDFESEVEQIARVRHPNIIRLRAYYFASDEKLLVSDFFPKGSLHSALHGGPSNSPPHLSWATRLKIAQGAARGLTYVHEYGPHKNVHGNIKSSKILLGDDFQPYISGFGLTRLIRGYKSSDSISKKHNSTQFVSSAVASKVPALPSASSLAPEARSSGSKLTQKSDVYAFGIVLLEILTGRSPDFQSESSDVGLDNFVKRAFDEERPMCEIVDPSLLHEIHAKKQVLATFHIALGCTEMDPEMRPRMKAVSDSLDRIGCQ